MKKGDSHYKLKKALRAIYDKEQSKGKNMASGSKKNEEKEFLKNYDRSAWPAPSLTADIAVFSLMQEEGEAYRRDPENKLKLLMIQRGGHPYKDLWALPGGFCLENESIEETAARELKEETNVSEAYLDPIGMFSERGRDPRGWIVSQAFLSLIDPADYRLRAGSDAWKAAWFNFHIEETEESRKADACGASAVRTYQIRLENKEGCVLSAVIRENYRCDARKETRSFQLLNNNGFAFDHALIILRAFLKLRREAELSSPVLFYLLPKHFTLNQLQKAYEIVLNRPILTANFRRKMQPFVRETEEYITGPGHRPARLFCRTFES